MAKFIDCTSVSISYNVMGIATINFTVISDSAGISTFDSISLGGRTFTGYIANIYNGQIPNSSWYATQVTLVGTS